MERPGVRAFGAGAVIGTLGGLIGLGGAEFRLSQKKAAQNSSDRLPMKAAAAPPVAAFGWDCQGTAPLTHDRTL